MCLCMKEGLEFLGTWGWFNPPASNHSQRQSTPQLPTHFPTPRIRKGSGRVKVRKPVG